MLSRLWIGRSIRSCGEDKVPACIPEEFQRELHAIVATSAKAATVSCDMNPTIYPFSDTTYWLAWRATAAFMARPDSLRGRRMAELLSIEHRMEGAVHTRPCRCWASGLLTPRTLFPAP